MMNSMCFGPRIPNWHARALVFTGLLATRVS
jgi:hypothetical protein